MMNILSVERGHHVFGRDINDWCCDQILNHRSHEKDARRLMKKNYSDTKEYEAIYICLNSGINSPTVIAFKNII